MNWGYKLLFAFIVFIGGMGYLVYRSMHTDFQLVEKEYYKSELRYQQVIDGRKKAEALSQPVRLLQREQQIVLQLPPELEGTDITGRIWFYCAYDASRDQQFKLSVDTNGHQLFDAALFKPGSYSVKIEWNSNGEHYYSEQPLEVI